MNFNYNIPPKQRRIQRLVAQFNADEELWFSLEGKRRRRKLHPRMSTKLRRQLDLLEFANARLPQTVSVFGRQTLTQDRSFLAAVAQAIDDISDALPHLIRLPQGKAWIDYDEEADILYVGLKRPQKATDTKFLADQGILLRYRDKELVGVTVLDASKPRRKKKKRSS